MRNVNDNDRVRIIKGTSSGESATVTSLNVLTDSGIKKKLDFSSVEPLALTEKPLWSDEFAGVAGAAPSSSNWTMDVGGHGWGNNELQSFTPRPSNVSLDGNGHLRIIARQESYLGPDGRQCEYTSGRLHTKGKFSMQYGRLIARVKIPAGQGLWSCVWMMGDDVWDAGWPNCGEIDIVEVLGHAPNTGYGSVHGPIGTTQNQWGKANPIYTVNPLSGDYHDYGIIWSPDTIKWTLDGQIYAQFNKSAMPAGARWVFDHGFHPILSLAVGGSWPGNPDRTTSFPATMLVDWVRAYA